MSKAPLASRRGRARGFLRRAGHRLERRDDHDRLVTCDREPLHVEPATIAEFALLVYLRPHNGLNAAVEIEADTFHDAFESGDGIARGLTEQLQFLHGVHQSQRLSSARITSVIVVKPRS